MEGGSNLVAISLPTLALFATSSAILAALSTWAVLVYAPGADARAVKPKPFKQDSQGQQNSKRRLFGSPFVSRKSGHEVPDVHEDSCALACHGHEQGCSTIGCAKQYTHQQELGFQGQHGVHADSRATMQQCGQYVASTEDHSLRQQQAQQGKQQEAGAVTPFMHTRQMGLVEYSPQVKRLNPYDPSPRTGYLQWDDYFMALAFLSAQRSKDPSKQVGAVIVDANRVVLGIGYNGFPRGCPDNALPWAKKAKVPRPGSSGTVGCPLDAFSGVAEGAGWEEEGEEDPLGTKYPYVVHAEANALLNKNSASVSGASVYVTLFPCNECAKLLIQAGIREVVYHEGKVQDDHQHHNGQPYWHQPHHQPHHQPPQQPMTHAVPQVTPAHSPAASVGTPGGSSTPCDTSVSSYSFEGFNTPGWATVGSAGGVGCGDSGCLKGQSGANVGDSCGRCGSEGVASCTVHVRPPYQPPLSHAQPQQQQLAPQQAGHHEHHHHQGRHPQYSYLPPRAPIDPSDACYVASKRLLTLAGIKLRQHRLEHTVVLKGT